MCACEPHRGYVCRTCRDIDDLHSGANVYFAPSDLEYRDPEPMIPLPPPEAMGVWGAESERNDL